MASTVETPHPARASLTFLTQAKMRLVSELNSTLQVGMLIEQAIEKILRDLPESELEAYNKYIDMLNNPKGKDGKKTNE